jgi:hypothetical protein
MPFKLSPQERATLGIVLALAALALLGYLIF